VNWLVVVDELYFTLSFLTIFWNTIMIIYFLTSRRVRKTYIKNAKIPKKPASSNKTVKGWIVYQAVIGIILFVVFQFVAWEETAEYSEAIPCIEYCAQYLETGGYYFGYDIGSAGLLCECQTDAGELIASATYSSGIMNPETISQEESDTQKVICNYNAYNCADFNTQAEAQAVMIYCGNDDIHYLDGDDDGKACEVLP
jgi:heme/copper-type cytochrome/quinol oxidase subunit 2